MVIIFLCGATCFTGVFLGVGGGDVVTDFVMGLELGKWGTFWVMMAIVFVLGIFIDWIGIVLICFPLFLPIVKQFGSDPIWFVIMMVVNLLSLSSLLQSRGIYQQSMFGRFLPLRFSGSGILIFGSRADKIVPQGRPLVPSDRHAGQPAGHKTHRYAPYPMSSNAPSHL